MYFPSHCQLVGQNNGSKTTNSFGYLVRRACLAAASRTPTLVLLCSGPKAGTWTNFSFEHRIGTSAILINLLSTAIPDDITFCTNLLFPFPCSQCKNFRLRRSRLIRRVQYCLKRCSIKKQLDISKKSY